MAKVNIFLGNKCNFNCSYCLQSFKEDDYLHQDKVDVVKLVDNLSVEIRNRTINKVAYWGGEPLMYFKTIKTIHDMFHDKGVRFNSVRVLTNGSLFTDEIVEYFNRMDIHVGISIHEGFGTPNWEMIKKLRRWSVIFLYTGSNPDFDILGKTKELENFLGRKVFPFFHWVRATDSCGDEDYFTPETLEIHKKYLYTLADKRLNGDETAYGLLQPHISKFIAKMKQVNFNGAMCMNNRILTVDLYGNTYSCHHSPVKENMIGNIHKHIDNEVTKKAKEVQMKFVTSAECMTCPIRAWCRGNCYLSNTHEMDCELQKIKYELFSYILKIEEGFIR